MGKKTKLSIKPKHLTIAIWVCLFALVVVALAPSSPTLTVPANNSVYFNPTPLICSGSTDPESDPIRYEIYVNHNFSNISNSNYELEQIDGSVATFTPGTSFASPNVISFVSVSGGAVRETRINYNDVFLAYTNNITIQLEVPDVGGVEEIDSAGLLIDDTRIEFISSPGPLAVTNISKLINNTITNFNLSQQHDISFYIYESNAGSNSFDIEYWIDFLNQDIIDNTTTPNTLFSNSSSGITSITFPIVEDSNMLLRCKACDNTGLCSSYTITHNVTLNSMRYSYCTSGNVAYNVTFRNETTPSQVVNATITAYDSTFDSNDVGDYDFSYSTSDSKAYYPFCLDPSNIGANESSKDVRYSATSFPSRQYYTSAQTLTGGSQAQQTLYLLDSASGSYVTFQVVDGSGGIISNALVSVNKVISGTSTTIVSGLTDSSGSITFWLDPLLSHTVTATKSGYPSFSESITPTQSSYTITLGGATSDYVSLLWGIEYDIEPNDIILNNGTTYMFKYNISSTYWNLTTYGFTLRNTSNGAIINTTTGSTASGSPLNVSLNTGNYTSLTMFYFYNINGNYTNGTQTWKVKSTSQGSLSLMNFFDDLRNFTAAGFDDFGRAIISIIIILFVTGWVAWEFGVYNPVGIATVVVLLVWVLEFVGLIPMLPVEVLGQQRRYLISVTLTGLLVAFYLQENSR